MIEKTVLPGGVRLLVEELPYVRSAAFGIWVGTGSRHETPALAGASHALEHMVFKGTGTRTAAQIAQLMDSIGGQLNAFTTKECTCFYGRALESHLTEALALICDIFFDPKLDESDWQTERGVILEEIDMYQDTPEDLVTERLFTSVFKGSTLGKPILGNARALKSMTAAQLKEYRATQYRPGDIVVSLAGCFSPAHRQFLTDRFTLSASTPRVKPAATRYNPARITKKKAIEQNHWCLGFPGLPIGDECRHSLQVLSGIAGGGMSSRLFQAVREQAGLCYEISTFSASHQDIGLFGVYIGLNAASEQQALPMIQKILLELADHGPTSEEVDRTREQLKASAVMGMESTQSRMNHMGQSELLLKRVLTIDEMMARCDAVTKAGCRDLAASILDLNNLCFSAVGRVGKPEEYFPLLGIN